MLNWISAPNIFDPVVFKSQVPHVVSAKTYAGMSYLL